MPEVSISRTRHRYFKWLCDQINTKRVRQTKDFQWTLLHLFERPFTSFVPNDENRAIDGKMLRDRYIHDTRWTLSEEEMLGTCSVLEMMIALSQRWAFNIFDPAVDTDYPVALCFWQMIDNLGTFPNDPDLPARIDVLVNREYEPNGVGGLFPLRNPILDQRRVEIWYQMMDYIREHL